MHFSKINQIYFIYYYSFINEWERFTLKFFEIQCCLTIIRIFRVNSKKKFSSCTCIKILSYKTTPLQFILIIIIFDFL